MPRQKQPRPDFLGHYSRLLAFERKLWQSGTTFIAGVDEAGRGPLAGPVVAAAVIFPKDSRIPPVNDSKQLTEKERCGLRRRILDLPGIRYAVCEVQSDEIDKINILRATHLGMRNALLELPETQIALVDGLKVPNLPVKCNFIVKGDTKSASIAAASILAKVHRDGIMMMYAEKYPQYGFERHKGYGTEDHLNALKKHGPCPIHRKSFAPVRDIINPPPSQGEFTLS
ncbi:MAG: ribonuclease HII [Lentisphaerae bacterium GWF2_49_21]|nr:MAG: ribonuclease HII [Lentisphaerae bacterium GWF2_49_21]